MTAPSLAYQDAMNGIAILYDALSNAENELDKLKNPWIKCSERLPKLYQTVFSGIISKDVLLYGIPYNDGEEEMRVFVGYMREDNEFYTEDSGKCDVVTHWQPLPAPPKDK